MDERELSKMFRDAAGTPPPASFDHDDVVGASRRAAARRRSALAGGSLLGVAVLGGGVLLGGQLLQQPAPPREPAQPPPAVATAPEPAPGGRMASPQPMPQPMRTLDAPGGPAAAGLAGCGPADPVLAAELEDALADRLVAPPGPTIALTEPCPAGSRAAGVPVSTGRIYLVVSPAVTGTGEGGSTRPDGARSYTVASPRSGDLVSVLAVPASPQRPAPMGEQIDELARELATRL